MKYKNLTEKYAGNETEKVARNKYNEDYIDCLGRFKTEREWVKHIVEDARDYKYAGNELIDEQLYIPCSCHVNGLENKKGYMNNKDKGCILYSLGDPHVIGFNIIVAHIDSPRIDLKPNFLYEGGELAYGKTHTYGGIKNYQWTTIPLEIRGTIYKKDGTALNCRDLFNDITITISDIQAHLSYDQEKRTAKDIIADEEMNLILGSIYGNNEDKKESDRVKNGILNILKEKYNIEELDLLTSEIEIVPKTNPSYIGLDKGLIGGYGQDDRALAFAALRAEFDKKELGMGCRSTFIIFADKEEIGSIGNSGMLSTWWLNYFKELCKSLNRDYEYELSKSVCISADVNGAYDETWGSCFEKENACYINKGISVVKCTGDSGKYDSNDANAKTFNEIIRFMDSNDIGFQVSLMGRIGLGGGGTVSAYTAGYNIDTIDVGVPLLNMHSPYELTSTYDTYEVYKFYKLFLESFGKKG